MTLKRNSTMSQIEQLQSAERNLSRHLAKVRSAERQILDQLKKVRAAIRRQSELENGGDEISGYAFSFDDLKAILPDDSQEDTQGGKNEIDLFG